MAKRHSLCLRQQHVVVLLVQRAAGLFLVSDRAHRIAAKHHHILLIDRQPVFDPIPELFEQCACILHERIYRRPIVPPARGIQSRGQIKMIHRHDRRKAVR